MWGGGLRKGLQCKTTQIWPSVKRTILILHNPSDSLANLLYTWKQISTGCPKKTLFLWFLTAKEAVQQSIRLICVRVCLCQSWNSSFKSFISQSEHSFRLTDQSENSSLDQLYQLKSAVQLRLSNFNGLSLSTPFHFRFHN